MIDAAPAHPTATLLDDDADRLFFALSDRSRRRILVRIATAPDDAGTIAQDLGMSRQAVAKQFRVLEDAGIVRVERRGRRHVHSVAPERLRELSDVLGLVARGWERNLETLMTHAESGGKGTDSAGSSADVESKAMATDDTAGTVLDPVDSDRFKGSVSSVNTCG